MSLLQKVLHIVYEKYLVLWWGIDHKGYMTRKNAHLRRMGVRLHGNPRYIAPDATLDGTRGYALIELGDNCVLTKNVRILTHDFSPFHAAIATGRASATGREFRRVGRVSIGANVFIGTAAIVLPNVKIGDNSIIGAGAVVVRDIPPGVVAAGVPAKVVCTIAEYDRRAQEYELEFL